MVLTSLALNIPASAKERIYIKVFGSASFSVRGSCYTCGNRKWAGRMIECRCPRKDRFDQRDTDINVRGANMGPILGRQDPGGSHVGPIKFAIKEYISCSLVELSYL